MDIEVRNTPRQIADALQHFYNRYDATDRFIYKHNMPVQSFQMRLGYIVARNLSAVEDETDLTESEKNDLTIKLCRFYLKQFRFMNEEQFSIYCATHSDFTKNTDVDGWYEERQQFHKRVLKYSPAIRYRVSVALRSKLHTCLTQEGIENERARLLAEATAEAQTEAE